MSPRTIPLTDPLYVWFLEQSLREEPVMSRLRAATAALGDAAGMQIAPEQGQFMALLVELTGATRILEIGTFTGYSALACALVLPPGGRLVACDVSEEWTAIGRRYWEEAGVADRIDLRLGPALATLDRLIGDGDSGRFDMAFIDADKTATEAYYERCLTLLRPGGLVLVDNMFRGGDVADPAVTDAGTLAMRAFAAKMHADQRVGLSLVPIGDGLALARKRA